MKKFFIIVFFIILSSFSIVAQRFSSFSNNYGNTVEEMRSFLETSPPETKKDRSLLLEQFSAFWTNPFIDSELQENFILCANSMLKKNMTPFPYFSSFISAFIAFSSSDLNEKSNIFREMILYHVAHEKGSFAQKMNFYKSLFENNEIYKIPNVKWRVEGFIEDIGYKESPYISYSEVNLIGIAREDSLSIFGTSGRYYISLGQWDGFEGTVDWDRAGLGYDVHAELAKYTINLSTVKYNAKDATLYYPDYFLYPVKGTLEDKADLIKDAEKAYFPRFTSNDNSVVINDFFSDVDYVGGFELRGATIIGSASDGSLSQVNIKKKNNVVISLKSLTFMFKNGNILSDDARVSIYFSTDSLFHTSAKIRYNNLDRELLISRQTTGAGRSPFIDSYHKLDIYAESIYWKIDNERIEIRPVFDKTHNYSAFFESTNYYDDAMMYKIKGYNDVTPLYTLWQVFKQHEFKPLPFLSIVSFFKRSKEDIRQLLLDFAAQGFIEYDMEKDIVSYRPKIANYLNNESGRRDFDLIKLESKSHSASIDLLTNHLRVNDCEFFVLSDAKIVNVYPANNSVIIQQNRNMQFSGRVIAGLVDFCAHNCFFDYDKFEIEMNVIDSMIFYVEDKNGGLNMYGERKLKKIDGVLEDLSGTLYIDKPNNKSGKKDYPEYPIFENRKNAMVYFDRHEILGGEYDRDIFYYSVDLFRLENLDNLKVDSINFTGHLVSGNIFPDITEPLKIRPDFSFGMFYNTENKFLPMYEGAGNYSGIIDLSNKGLIGKGTINYLTSVSNCDSLTFYLKKTTGKALHHLVNPQVSGVEFPHAAVSNASLYWEPYSDKMIIRTQKEKMSIFDETEFTGFSKLTSQGMYGGGILSLNKAQLYSKNFLFKHHELSADTADLKIFALKNADLAFSTENYKSHIDFATREGNFVSNGDVSEVNFIKNGMRTNASRFDWIPIDKNILYFKWENDPYKETDINNTLAEELIEMPGTNLLVATDPGKSGLKFNVLEASFDFEHNIIKADGVRFINVGDGAVIPNNGKVTVLENANIEDFTKSRIVVGRNYAATHTIYNANIKVFSGNRLRGNGYFDYIDENKTSQTIYFDTLWCINTIRGDAKIPASSDFKFSPHFGFDGRAEIHSVKEFLYFVGGVEFINDCDTVKKTKLRILQEIDPKNILIEINNRSKDVADRKAVVAIASANSNGKIYTCFGAAKEQYNDAEYISAFGYITYDKEKNSFVAASKEKLENPDAVGNIISLDVYNCISTGIGSIDMGTKLGRIDFNTDGTIYNYIHADSADMNLTTSIDFFFNDKAMQELDKSLRNSMSIEFLDVYDDDLFQNSLKNILGEDQYFKFQQDVFADGTSKNLPEKLKVQFLFAEIHFEWDNINSAFISQKQLPLVICGKKQTYLSVPGEIVIEKKGSRNRLYIYFKIDNEYYIFNFENNIMYCYSSVAAFNDAISSTKAKKRSLSHEGDKPAFSYQLGNKSIQKRFLKKYPLEHEEGDEEDLQQQTPETPQNTEE